MQADQFGQQKQLRGLQMQGMQGDMQSQQFKQFALQQFAQTLPPDQQMRFWADPKAFMERKIAAPGSAVVSGAGIEGTIPNKPPAPTSFTQLLQERDSLSPGDPRRKFYDDRIAKETSHQPATKVEVNTGPQTPGDKKVDETFAKEYSEFVTGGYADTVKQLGQLDEAVKLLEASPEGSITGPKVGILPRQALAVLNPEAANNMELVEEVVQRNLRLILGAQFTEKEGERLIARAYNPYLSQSANAKRVRRLVQQIQSAADAKLSAAKYFQENGTLKGWQGKLMTKEDFKSMKFDDVADKSKAPTVIKYDAQGNRVTQ
jgi:hypothetical protein